MKTTHLPGRACPTCGAPNTGAMDVHGAARPEPGDYSICLACRSVATFDAGLQLVAVPAADVPPDVAADVARLRRFPRVH